MKRFYDGEVRDKLVKVGISEVFLFVNQYLGYLCDRNLNKPPTTNKNVSFLQKKYT